VSRPERLRLFVAVDVPEHQRRVLERTVAPLREEVRGARWAPLANQHVTIKFLGSTPVELMEEVWEVIGSATAAREPAKVRLTEMGAFPTVRRARVLWCGMDDRAGLLPGMAGALDRGFEPLGFRVEKRVFTPHLTIARFRQPARLEGRLPSLPAEELDPFTVEAVGLYRSHLSPKGARYELLESFPIGTRPGRQ
jgi:2'-5' RNA ligase